VATGGVAAKEFSEYLKGLVMGAEQPIFLIVDEHLVHCSAKSRKLAKSHDRKMKFFYFAPCSLKLDPDEHIWNDLKKNGVGQMHVAGPDDLKSMAISHLNWMQNVLG
jgi:hypothetical protein